MWNLKSPDISAVRAQLETVFPSSAKPKVLSKSQKDALEALYKEYELALGRPDPIWSTALTEPARTALLSAYDEVQEKGRLSALRSSLTLHVNECPYCGYGEINSLDHHLQKAYFNCFSIFPLNLVPACGKCNGHKPRKPKTDLSKQHIHAYLEDLSGYQFFEAQLSWNKNALCVKFGVKKQPKMNQELFARLEQHVSDFKLNIRYPAQVNTFLNEQRTSFEMSYESGGAEGVSAYLERSSKGMKKKFGRNDWRVALFLALAKSKKFCNGGFNKALGKK